MQNNLQLIRNGEIIEEDTEVKYFPAESRKELISSAMTKIPVAKISTMGAGFSSLASTFTSVSQTVAGGEGLYYVSFNGVSGALAQAKDGSGYLGTVMNNGIAGQSRLTPATTTAAAFNPATFFMAAAIYNMDQKLDAIKEMQEEIMDFLKQDKEAQIRTDLLNLTDILDNYKFNWANEKYVTAKLSMVQNIKRDARKNIDFYESRIKKAADKKDFIHIGQNAKEKMLALQKEFEYYRMSMHLYSFATFIEVMLIGNFEEAYLKNVADGLSQLAYDYKIKYTDCYNKLEDYAKSSLEIGVVKGVGSLSKIAGETIAKIPVVSKGQADEALIEAGQKMKAFEGNTEKILAQFTENKDTAVPTFIENIGTVNRLYNKPVNVLFDHENVYIGEAV